MPSRLASRRSPAALVLLLAVLLAAFWPPTAASACSCAPATLEELVERDPAVAVALVRRTDAGGRGHGTGAVLHRVRGDLPNELDLRLDDGGSCAPAVGPGELATLAFRPAGGGWETLDCGELPLEVAVADRIGPLAVDQDAAGPPAVALSGGLPGVDVAVLDDHLRVLAVTDVPAGPGRLHRCGDDLLVETMDDRSGDVSLARLDGATLAVAEELAVAAGDIAASLLDVSCDDDQVRALVLQDGGSPGGQVIVLRSLTAATDDGTEVADGQHAAFAGDRIVVLRGSSDGQPATVTALDAVTGDEAWTVELAGIGADAVHASPDGRAIALGHYGDDGPETVVLDAATGEELGRGAAGRVPRWESPWAGPDRLVLADDGTGYLEPARPLEDGVVDAQVRPLSDLPALLPASLTAHEHGLLAVGSAELTVVTPAGDVLVSDDLALTGTGSGLLLAPVVAAAPPPAERSVASLATDAPVSPDEATGTTAGDAVTVPPGGGTSNLLLVAGGVMAAGALLGAGAITLRRRTS